MKVVFDASALLAAILNDPGVEKITPHFDDCVMSTVNITEVRTKLSEFRISEVDTEQLIGQFSVQIVSLTEIQAIKTARIRLSTRKFSLSLGDGACLALESLLELPVLTADRQWAKLKSDLDIRLIR